MYQRYWGGNMDEGWTRLVLEVQLPCHVDGRRLQDGNLNEKVDVIILPADRHDDWVRPRRRPGCRDAGVRYRPCRLSTGAA